jgi:methylphosphotriester-DNA--protein-cysteine methyltransferase
MIRNITFSAEEELIEEAREAARTDNTTLNEQFRLWLEQYARKQRAERAMKLIAELQGKINTGGRKFTRDEMNERR